MRRVEFIGRQWNLFDIATSIVVLLFHILSLLAPFYFNWGAFWLFVALYILTGLGITLGYHRSLAHRSFKLPRWLELFCLLRPIEWVSTHRYHHQFTDTKKDPHSPLMGFWFSHIGWIFNNSFRFAVRTVVLYHITFSVNSIGHIWGRQAWDTGDFSKNNWLVALPTLGEGWHNNHHVDITWYLIRFLQVASLATDVKTPTGTHKKRKALHKQIIERNN
ncbi:palmitoyl-monogalactosyldiacylglycerol delta-7 desaturase [Pyrus ussuriensis x Pyrus communis]|uniref:Palmitoyl-monogalactosyldiacylglycerol delta-7 desaturase n=1 Tax=Pyrus ussuriensis x Pyrus communis TaxID=2448454 RepID=A0A5N5I2N4_9ROSA|nr:palmitoyl-monogalactosyldiacylglycerol delta-7 desaturase [Pyrus ussuriensis x Pyrus communis]